MIATEKVRYTPDPNNPNETLAIKEAWVESGLYGLRYECLLCIFNRRTCPAGSRDRFFLILISDTSQNCWPLHVIISMIYSLWDFDPTCPDLMRCIQIEYHLLILIKSSTKATKPCPAVQD